MGVEVVVVLVVLVEAFVGGVVAGVGIVVGGDGVPVPFRGDGAPVPSAGGGLLVPFAGDAVVLRVASAPHASSAVASVCTQIAVGATGDTTRWPAVVGDGNVRHAEAVANFISRASLVVRESVWPGAPAPTMA